MLFIEQVKRFKISENFQITRVIMSKVMQNLVVLMDPSERAAEIPLKVGKMVLNRFCIDEGAAFELSGVNYLGKENSFLRSYFI